MQYFCKKNKSMESDETIIIELEVLVEDSFHQRTDTSKATDVRAHSALRAFNIKEIMYIQPSFRKNRAYIVTPEKTYTTLDNYKTIVKKLCAIAETEIKDSCFVITPYIFYVIGKKHIVQGTAIQEVDMAKDGLSALLLKMGKWQDKIELHTQEEKEHARRAWASSCVTKASLGIREELSDYARAQMDINRQNDVARQKIVTMEAQIQQLQEQTQLLKQRLDQLETRKS